MAGDGTKLTFLNAILSKMPEIRLSPIRTSFGSAEFSAALAKGKAPGDTDSNRLVLIRR